jgi:hypothetical protein
MPWLRRGGLLLLLASLVLLCGELCTRPQGTMIYPVFTETTHPPKRHEAT